MHKSSLFLLLFAVQRLFTVVLGTKPTIIIHPGNLTQPDRPWRIWSGDPCNPCKVKQARFVGDYIIEEPLAICEPPCSKTGTEKCIPKGEFEFKCECQDLWQGKFCQSPKDKKTELQRWAKTKTTFQYENIGRYRVDKETSSPLKYNATDVYYKCEYLPTNVTSHKEIYYELNFFKMLYPDLKPNSLEFPSDQLLLPFETKCNTTSKSDSTKCSICLDAYTSDKTLDFGERLLFMDLYWEPYEHTPDCTNIIEKYSLLPLGYYYLIRNSSDCRKRESKEVNFRSGCRTDSAVHPDAKVSCIASKHMGQKCITCEIGVWGDKCQYVDECLWGTVYPNVSKAEGGCHGPEYRKHGPCGKGGTCVSRPNGKFCVCPKGKIDGFVNVRNDRIKNRICSPAGDHSDKDVPTYDEYNKDDSLKHRYKMFLDFSPFHTYLGCQIDDPCENFGDCLNGGTKQIIQLVDESTDGFKKPWSRMSEMRYYPFHAIEVSDKLKCKCFCKSGYFGVDCGQIDPCFGKEICERGGTCVSDGANPPKAKCICPEEWEGEHCTLLNRCKIDKDETFDCETKDCYPCKHNGECTAVYDDIDKKYEYTCDCSGTNYIGKACECEKGEINLSLLNGHQDAIIAGEPYTYKLIAIVNGSTDPEIIVYPGDNSQFKVDYKLFENNIYTYNWTYVHEDKTYIAVAKITNCQQEINDQSPKSEITLKTILRPETHCLPKITLRNVDSGHPPKIKYLKSKTVTVELDLEDCDLISDFEHHWKLFLLSGIPGPVDNLHFDSDSTYITFHERSLSNGVYSIEYWFHVVKDGKIIDQNVGKGFFEIELDPPKIIIENIGGSEEISLITIDVFEEFVLDASNSEDPSYPETNHLLKFSWSCQPSPCEFNFNNQESILKIPQGFFKVGSTYEIHLDLSSTHNGMSASSKKKIEVVGSTEGFQVDCKHNCENFNPEDQILVKCECTTCNVNDHPNPKVTFSWEPISDNVIPDVHDDDASYATIKLPTVLGNDYAKRKVICSIEGDKGKQVEVANFVVPMNKPPHGGTCSIQPETGGVYLQTTFDFECRDYEDQDQPLIYSFYSKVDGDAGKDLGNVYLLAHDTNPIARNVYLPFNLNNEDTEVQIRVTDAKGLSTPTERINVKVTLPDRMAYPAMLEKLIYGENSAMKNFKEKGDDQKAMQLQLVVLHGLLNKQFDGLPADSLVSLTESISDVLTQIPQHSFKAVEQTLNTLYLLKQHTIEKQEAQLNDSSVVLFDSTAMLARLVVESERDSIPPETVETLARAATDSARRILNTTFIEGMKLIELMPIQSNNARMVTDFDEDDEIERDYHFKETDDGEFYDDVEEDHDGGFHNYSVISHRAYRAFEHLLDAVGERLPIGEHFEVQSGEPGKPPNVVIFVEAERQVDPEGGTITIDPGNGKGVSVKISGDLHEILQKQSVSHIQIQLTEVLDNPFFDDSSAVIGTPVVSIVIKNCTPGGLRLPIELDGVDNPFEFMMPLTPTAKGLLEMSRSERTVTLKPLQDTSDDDLQPYLLILPYNTRVEITLDDHPLNAEFAIVIMKDFYPLKQHFCQNPDDEDSTLKILNKDTGYTTDFTTEHLGLNEEANENYLEYYVTIYMYDKPENYNSKGKYSVYFTRATCLYRDENKKIWSETGCILGNKTTATSLHCICNHATVFAGTQFAVPNEIPTLNIFDFEAEEFEKNPVVLTTVCVILAAYVIGMIICFLLDRRDRNREVGITIMADLGDDLDQSYYLITVLTGSRFGAGTTANVSMQLYGTHGRSQVYVLRETTSPVLNRGGLDTFLVSSQKELGEIEKIRIWHDNAGSSPDWYCRKIIIRNIKSNVEWCIFIDKWLHITGIEATVIVEKPIATAREYKNFTRRFRENLRDQFDNSHLWLSVFLHPTSSRFSRCQRLSCALAIFTSYMMLNIMFYGIELEDPNDEFGLQTYVLSLQMTVLALPFGFILTMFFRRIRQRYIPTLIIWRNKMLQSAEQTSRVFIPEKAPVAQFKKIPKKHLTFGHDTAYDLLGSGDINEQNIQDNISESSSKFSIPSTNIEELEAWLASEHAEVTGSFGSQYVRRVDDEQERATDLIGWGRMGLVHAVRAADPHSFIFSGDHDVEEIENLIDEEIQRHLLRGRLASNDNSQQGQGHFQGMVQGQSFPVKSVDEEDLEEIEQTMYETKEEAFQFNIENNVAGQENRSGLAFETCKMSPQRKAFCYLPWWFIYFAWIICVGLIITCLYFTLLYGLHYGYLRSIDWLIGITASFLMSLFIIQPLNILLSAFVLTLVCSSKEWTITDAERYQILISEAEEYLGKKLPLNFRVFHAERRHPPLSGFDVFNYKMKARQRDKLRSGLTKLLFYGLLLIPLVILAYSNHNKDNFDIVNNMKNLLKFNDDDPLVIRSEADLYEYLEKTVIPVMNPEYMYNGNRFHHRKFDPVFLEDSQNLLLGVGRIRQVRVPKEKCELPDAIRDTFSDCYGPYSISHQDTKSYDTLWRPLTKPRVSSNDYWKFNDNETAFSMSRTISGQMATYYGGGYAAELGRQYRQSMSVIRSFKRTRWIDKQTRGLFIEFTILNPNSNVFADVLVIIERGASQTFETSYQITPVSMYPAHDLEDDEFLPWVNIAYLMVLVALIILIVIVLRNIFAPTELRAYRKMWFWLDVTMICCIIASLSIALKKHFVEDETMEKIEKMKINEYINLQKVAFWIHLQSAAFSITQCICFMKIWKLCVLVDGRFLVTSLTVRLAYGLIIAYFFVVLIILIGFACAGHFIFGSVMAQFDSFRDSFITLIGQSIAMTFALELQDAHPFWGPIYSCVFGFLVTCVFLNILLAVLNQSLTDAKMISREKYRRWDLSRVVQRLFTSNKATPPNPNAVTKTPLVPERLEAMKRITANFFRESLIANDAKTVEIKQFTDKLLEGTGCRMVSRRSRQYLEEQARETRLKEMRMHATVFLQIRMGTEMSPEEMETYNLVNRYIVGLRIWKLEKRFMDLKRKFDRHFF